MFSAPTRSWSSTADRIAGMRRSERSSPVWAAGLRSGSAEPVIVRHHTARFQIDVTGPDEVSSRCYYQVLSKHGLDHWGRYVDRYRMIDERWYFLHRREFLDGFAPDSSTQTIA